MASESKIHVLISSRYALFRSGLRALLEKSLVFQVMGDANTTRQTVRLAKRLHPDVVLLDPGNRSLNGPETCRLLKEDNPALRIVVLVVDEQQIADCLGAGASAYVWKEEKGENLRTAVYSACRGKTFAA